MAAGARRAGRDRRPRGRAADRGGDGDARRGGFQPFLKSCRRIASSHPSPSSISATFGALALLLLLDQFPRNAFRGTARMYDTDARARAAAGHDQAASSGLRVFFYLPFGHSEDIGDQKRSMALARALGEPHATHAVRHHGIVQRFGRFPHRNPILDRTMTAAEQRFLDDGGYAG
jgi:uncharacterized protein (DUF924 family)